MRTLLSALTVAGLFFAGSAQAAPEEYEFDKTHTQILFFVNHLGFSNSQGEFHDYDGGFTFDAEKPETSSVDVTIMTGSLDMDDATWDEHVKGENFLDVVKFPEMTFKSTAIDVTGENTGKVTGDLTLLGVTKPVVLDVTFNKADTHPYSGKYVAGFSGSTTLKRSEFGMNYGLPAVGDDVTIRLEVEGVRVDPKMSEESEEAPE